MVSKRDDFFFLFLCFLFLKTYMELGQKVAFFGNGAEIWPLENGRKTPESSISSFKNQCRSRSAELASEEAS